MPLDIHLQGGEGESRILFGPFVGRGEGASFVFRILINISPFFVLYFEALRAARLFYQGSL